MINYVVFVVLYFVCMVNGEGCPNDCSAHGRCNYNQICECFEGYMGGDCSLYKCPLGPAWVDFATNDDTAHALAECSNKGMCKRESGQCLCLLGFTGQACERTTCPNSCNGVGKCQSLTFYAKTKDPGLDMDTYPGPPDEINKVFTYNDRWDASMIYGCSCDSRFHGYDCSLQRCPTGDDPKTPNQFNEIQRCVCKAGGGTFTLAFRGETTEPIPFNAGSSELQKKLAALSTVTDVRVTLFTDALCGEEKGEFTIEFRSEFGNLPMLVPNPENLFFADPNVLPAIAMSEQISGSKENDDCSYRGLCDPASGFCTCSTNYKTSNGYNLVGTRGDCGYVYDVVNICPGLISCSGHGMCTMSPTFRCECSEGWAGADCSERLCPKGTSWFAFPSANEELHVFEHVECSNQGLCDRASGRCTCRSGFSGASCNVMECPGQPLCSGHGECYSMSQLARISTYNGVLRGVSYGDTPNNPATWDAHMIRGCVCNLGYQGYDCALRTCPTGDNPDSHLQVDETQEIECTDVDVAGEIVFNYKEELTMAVHATASPANVKMALEKLTGLREVNVWNTTEGALCSTTGGGHFRVTFLTEHGDLPLIGMGLGSSGIDTFIVTEITKGTKEDAPCSDRGICNEESGTCQCFQGYTASDGKGGPGVIANCGHVEKVVAALGE